jgi:hypothetical protein
MFNSPSYLYEVPSWTHNGSGENAAAIEKRLSPLSKSVHKGNIFIDKPYMKVRGTHPIYYLLPPHQWQDIGSKHFVTES